MGINQYIKIGSKIKKARISKDIRQKDMADKLGLSVSTYSNYENNYRQPELDIIEKICGALDTTIDQLISNIQPKIGDWIPCSERLPEMCNPVLASYHRECDNFSKVVTAHLEQDGELNLEVRAVLNVLSHGNPYRRRIMDRWIEYLLQFPT